MTKQPQFASADGRYIERTGNIEPLTPRVESYIREALGGLSLDETHSHEQRRVDYVCLDGQLAIEIKSLEGDPSGRLDNLTDAFRERDDWPMFLGPAPIDAFLKNTTDPDGLRRQMIGRIGRAIITHLSKADKQLAAHAADFDHPRLVRIMVLINEDHAQYDPHMVGYILSRALEREEDGELLYRNVDAVVFMTERHALAIEGQITFPVLTVDSPSIRMSDWKAGVVERFVNGWPAWNGMTHRSGDASLEDFSAIEHIPNSGSLSDRWRIEYNRQPYLRSLTDEKLRDHFDEIMVQVMLETLKSSPLRLGQDVMMMLMQSFSDLQMEIGARGIPIDRFSPTREREVKAAIRLGWRLDLMIWLYREHAMRGLA